MTADVILFAASTVVSLLYKISLKRSSRSNENDGDEFYDCITATAATPRNDNTNNNRSDDLVLMESLRNRTSLNANELICHVTSNNEEVVVPHNSTCAGILRSDMRLHNLWHRATYTLIIMESMETLTVKLQNKPTVTDGKNTGNNTDPLSAFYNDTYILVQRRSAKKDYCPRTFDPLPGGVVGYKESYRDNAIREIYEEMGISVSAATTSTATTQTTTPSNGNKVEGDEKEAALQRLFTFPFENERVRVWGELYTYRYSGTVDDLVLQREEVDSVLCLSLAELKERMETSPNDFMPDACYAMRLYFQHVTDQHVKRRLLHGYSSSNLDAYTLRPKPKVIFFDCDDCLYFDSWKTANILTQKIDEWCTNHGLPSGKAYELYKQYGTALRGLLAEGMIANNDHVIDDFLRDVHDIPIQDLIRPDPTLREILLQIDPTIPKYIFTASVRHHAVRCIEALGIADLFVDVIDCKACQLETKHSYKSFQIAMEIAGLKNDAASTSGSSTTYNQPELCLFFDDNIKNIEAARQIGWRSVLVGTIGRDCRRPIGTEHAEHEIDHIHHIPRIFPELFLNGS